MQIPRFRALFAATLLAVLGFRRVRGRYAVLIRRW